MRMPLNPVLSNLPVYQPGRPIEEVARELRLPVEAVIKLASNENPLGPSPAALAAMERALRQIHLYPDGNAYYLKQRLAAKLGLSPAHLILGNGSNEIIEFVGHALLQPESNIVVSEFCFAIYPIIGHMMGAKVLTVPSRDYGHDLRAMARAITPQTRAVFVANPNNPTGTLASRDDLWHLVEAVPDHVLLVLDEAYIEYLADPVDFLPQVREGRRPNLVLMRTFSKIYGLAGLRLGYGIGHPEFIAALEKIRQPFNTNALAQTGALAALDDEEHVQRSRQNNLQGLTFLSETCGRLQLEFVPSHANFLLIKVGDGQKVFSALQQQGIIVRPMGGYQLPEWIRVSVGKPEENARVAQALAQLVS
jgi:histidinol-phosphate aminotransferase